MALASRWMPGWSERARWLLAWPAFGMTTSLQLFKEIGALSGMSRQHANQCLKRLEQEGLLWLEYGGVTIVDLERLRRYGE